MVKLILFGEDKWSVREWRAGMSDKAFARLFAIRDQCIHVQWLYPDGLARLSIRLLQDV
jgi:hypothetical protein